MVGSGLFDDKDNGISGDLFNDVINFLDFPMENVEGEIIGGDWNAKFQCLGPLPTSVGLSSVFDGDICGGTTLEFPTDLSVSYEQKRLLNFVEDPSSGSIPLHNDSSECNQSCQFQTSSPVSVLESGSSCSVEKTMPVSPEIVIPACTPSKHPLPSTFNPQPVTPLISSTSSASEKFHPLAASESFSESSDSLESHLPEKILNSIKRKQKKKKKKKKLSLLSDAMGMKKYSLQRPVATKKCMHCEVTKTPQWRNRPTGPKTLCNADDMEMKKYSLQQPVATKKCMHCEVTKTPQWRNGPMGPKTLCNACGVRHRSGRLFPEYRPAASPTFVASLHSNSHKKVTEMRNNAGQEVAEATADATATDVAMSPPPEFIPMSSYLFD